MTRAIRVICLILLLLTAATAQGSVNVVLRDTATVSGRYVRLASVAALRGEPEAAERVGRLFLGPAPVTGEIRRTTFTLYMVGFYSLVGFLVSGAVLLFRVVRE